MSLIKVPMRVPPAALASVDGDGNLLGAFGNHMVKAAVCPSAWEPERLYWALSYTSEIQYNLEPLWLFIGVRCKLLKGTT